MVQKQHSFPQRIGKLVEDYIIDKEGWAHNKRQRSRGYYDAYSNTTLYEIKAAKNDNYFRIMQKNHELLSNASGSYVFVRYEQKDTDKGLNAISDILIKDIKHIEAINLQGLSKTWLEDQRQNGNMFYKVKL